MEVIEPYLIWFNAILLLLLFLIWTNKSWINITIKGLLFIGALLNAVWALRIIEVI